MGETGIRRAGRSGESVGRGILGAFIGAMTGAVLYALLLNTGRIALLAGLLSGRLASEWYDRSGGRGGLRKLPVIAAMLVLAVALGQVAGYTLSFNQSYNAAPFARDRLTRIEYVQGCWEMYLLCDQETALGRQYDRSMDDIPENMRVSREDHIRMNYMRDMDILREAMRHEFAVNYCLCLFMGGLGSLSTFIQAYGRNKKPARRELQ